MEECHSDLVSKIQGECVLSETVLPGLCDFTYSVPNSVKPQSLDESFIRCHGWLGHLGDCEWRTEADHRVHRERNYDGAVFSCSDVDVRRKDRKRLEEDTVQQRKDRIKAEEKALAEKQEAEQAKKSEIDDVVEKMLSDGVSADDILAKLK